MNAMILHGDQNNLMHVYNDYNYLCNSYSYCAENVNMYVITPCILHNLHA